MLESKLRSVLKSLSWRIIASLTTMIISFFVTHSFKFAASIGLIEVVSKIMLYYFHERAWNLFELSSRSRSLVGSRSEERY